MSEDKTCLNKPPPSHTNNLDLPPTHLQKYIRAINTEYSWSILSLKLDANEYAFQITTIYKITFNILRSEMKTQDAKVGIARS